MYVKLAAYFDLKFSSVVSLIALGENFSIIKLTNWFISPMVTVTCEYLARLTTHTHPYPILGCATVNSISYS